MAEFCAFETGLIMATRMRYTRVSIDTVTHGPKKKKKGGHSNFQGFVSCCVRTSESIRMAKLQITFDDNANIQLIESFVFPSFGC